MLWLGHQESCTEECPLQPGEMGWQSWESFHLVTFINQAVSVFFSAGGRQGALDWAWKGCLGRARQLYEQLSPNHFSSAIP